jgi:Fur family transcriptional regulator, ferric uptake regulator
MMERNTNQRRAIRQVFEEVGRPLSPFEVLELAKKHSPGLGIATVYRTIKVLVEDAWLAPVPLPNEAPRYEVAGKPHHHHFSCKQCGKVYDISGCPGDLKGIAPVGYQVESHDIVLYGSCAACAPKN